MPLIETKGAASAQGFGLTIGGAQPVYIEDVFSTYLYTGNGSTQTITNGIDLSTKGGLVWMKSRSAATDHALYDTVRGATKDLVSNSTAAETTQSTGLTSFASTGFSIGALAKINTNAATYVSWTFREQPKFFDVVTYTGNGTSNRAISHSLGSAPGCVIAKRTDSSTDGDWYVYHVDVGSSPSNSAGYNLFLNTTNDRGSLNNLVWGGIAPTSTTFTTGSIPYAPNLSGATYVAYLFAHNAGGFGLTGSDNVITCGSFTTDGSGNVAEQNLGFEPQWILYKSTNSTYGWAVVDNMRGWPVSNGCSRLYANSSAAEAANVNELLPTATGFKSYSGGAFAPSITFVYIAIRRGPMKVPTSGTSVLGLNKYSNTTDYQQITTGDLVDLGWQVLNGDGYKFFTRLIGSGYLNPTSTSAENTSAATKFDYMDGFAPYYANSVGAFNPREVYGFRRAPGFFDVVCYTGTGSATTQAHNLGVVPELMIVKGRSVNANWAVYSSSVGNTKALILNDTVAPNTNSGWWNDTSPTSTVFTIGTGGAVNSSGGTFVAWLFATCAGVSKVGSYTGTGTTLQVNCGFTGGARFVLIKRTDSTGDWYVWDSARGIVAGNDPYLLLNSTAAEVTTTDWVDTYSAGFELSNAAGNNVNINAATFIFLAIA